VADYYQGDEVKATSDSGGLFGDQIKAGTTGRVLESTGIGTTSKVLWSDGTITDVSNDKLGNR
jgi:hypothetical protein